MKNPSCSWVENFYEWCPLIILGSNLADCKLRADRWQSLLISVVKISWNLRGKYQNEKLLVSYKKGLSIFSRVIEKLEIQFFGKIILIFEEKQKKSSETKSSSRIYSKKEKQSQAVENMPKKKNNVKQNKICQKRETKSSSRWIRWSGHALS